MHSKNSFIPASHLATNISHNKDQDIRMQFVSNLLPIVVDIHGNVLMCCRLHELPLLIIKIKVLTWRREDRPNNPPFHIRTLKDPLLLVAYTNRYVLELNPSHPDLLAAMHPHRHAHTTPSHTLKRYSLNDRKRLRVETVIRVLIVVRLDHDASAHIVEGEVAECDAVYVATAARGCFDAHSTPRVEDDDVFYCDVGDAAGHFTAN